MCFTEFDLNDSQSQADEEIISYDNQGNEVNPSKITKDFLHIIHDSGPIIHGDY